MEVSGDEYEEGSRIQEHNIINRGEAVRPSILMEQLFTVVHTIFAYVERKRGHTLGSYSILSGKCMIVS